MILYFELLISIAWVIFAQQFGTLWLASTVYRYAGNVPDVILSYMCYLFLWAAPVGYLLYKYGIGKIRNRIPLNIRSLQIIVVGVVLFWVILFISKIILHADLQQGFIDELEYPYSYVQGALLIIFIPLFEEIFYRGIIFEELNLKFGTKLGFIVVGLLGVLAHYLAINSLGMVLYFFTMELLLTFIYFESGLVVSLFVHACVNWFIIYGID